MLNKWIGIGRITKDIELQYTQNGVAIARFTLAIDRNYKDANGNRPADFVPVIAWRKLAEICESNLKKGSLVAVAGEIRTGSYEKNGVKHYTTDVYANEVKFLDSKKKGNENSNSDFDDFTPVDIDDEDLPF